MTGTLGLFSLVDLFQLLASARRSGRLTVDHPRGRARVYFDKGVAVHADFDGMGGEEAVYALFADERGAFEFRIGMPAPEETIKSSTENLVLEAVRRLDEARRDAATPADPAEPRVSRDAIPTRATLADEALRTGGGVTLTTEEQVLIDGADGIKTIARLASQTGMDADRAVVVVQRLVKTGMLKLQTKRPRTARLVARLTQLPIATGAAGVDVNIVAAWERALERQVTHVACRREDGTVLVFGLQLLEGAGPFLELSRDAFVRANIVANEALLVRPFVPEQSQ
ncbi:MAG TPA: DUF4388 domain-containing protein [Trueperaceae bacterium]|nr:DUF4388 domain-containing protein [Trueperaceae bacterium]